MKRDLDLMRLILLEVEKWPFTGGFDTAVIPNHTDQEIAYHVYLLADAKLIEAVDASSMSGPRWYPKHITYEGHEFLEAARDQTRWTKAKASVLKSTGTLTLEALKAVLAALIKKALAGEL